MSAEFCVCMNELRDIRDRIFAENPENFIEITHVFNIDIPNALRDMFAVPVGEVSVGHRYEAGLILAKLCDYRQFDAAKWFETVCIKRACKLITTTDTHIEYIFRRACTKKRFDSARMMIEMLYNSQDTDVKKNIFCAVCALCDIDFVMWYIEKRAIDLAAIHQEAQMSATLVRECSGNKNPGVIQAVCNCSSRIKDEDLYEKYGDAFGQLCGISTLETVKWFAQKFEIDDKLAHNNRNFTLYNAASNGQFDIVMWLVETFHFTADEVMSDAFDSMSVAIDHRHPEISRWFASHFDLVHLPDATERANRSVISACAAGNKDIIAWLIDTFGLDCALAKNGALRMLQTTCYYGEIETAEWLIEKFGEGIFRTNHTIYVAFKTACESRQFRMAEWLITRFHVGEHALRAIYYGALIDFINNGPDGVVDWLLSKMTIETESDMCKSILRKRYEMCGKNHERVDKLFARIYITEQVYHEYDDIKVCFNEPVENMVKLITGKDLYTMSLDNDCTATMP